MIACRARAFAVAQAYARQLQSSTKATHRMLASGGGVVEPFPLEFPLLELPACLKVGDASSTKPTIAVAMSGGVDSSVTAWLLKQAGHNVFGIHMRNWDEEEEKGTHSEVSGHCSSAGDLKDAVATCKHLDIPLKQVGFVREYWTDVFEPMLDLYMSGVTPNPDVSCNREIKFKCLLREAARLGADVVATDGEMLTCESGEYARLKECPERGHSARLMSASHLLLATWHYARLKYTADGAMLVQARDGHKDQSYFLSSVPGSAFKKVMFPLGGLLKQEVRAWAVYARLPTAHKRESMGLCFIGRRRFDDFLNNYIPPASSSATNRESRRGDGMFVCVETGRNLAPHKGLHLYTIGQAARISGVPVAYYVADKVGSNILVAPHSEHPALYSTELLAGPVHWIQGEAPQSSKHAHPHTLSAEAIHVERSGALAHERCTDMSLDLHCSARIRHQAPLVSVRVLAHPLPASLSKQHLSKQQLSAHHQLLLSLQKWQEEEQEKACKTFEEIPGGEEIKLLQHMAVGGEERVQDMPTSVEDMPTSALRAIVQQFRMSKWAVGRVMEVAREGGSGSELVSVAFSKPQRAVAPGQIVALYDAHDNTCLGSAPILAPGKRLFPHLRPHPTPQP